MFVTTIPPDGLTVTEALVLARARWQIELLFKLWKSHGQIDLVRDVQPWRVLCELYGRLLNQIVQHWLLLVSRWDAPARVEEKRHRQFVRIGSRWQRRWGSPHGCGTR
ncbi:MAG: transposase [Kouleothrix sp.]